MSMEYGGAGYLILKEIISGKINREKSASRG